MNFSFMTYGCTAQLLDRVLQVCGDVTSVILEDDGRDEKHNNCFDVLISENAVAVAQYLSTEKEFNDVSVIVLLASGEDAQRNCPESLPSDKMLMLSLGSSPPCFTFTQESSNLYVNRVKQHISICLIRSGYKILPTNNIPRDGTPALSFGRSFAEMVLPACELGLPCDDCGRCH